MSRLIRNFAPGEFYHIYNRGVRKNNIFEEPVDFWRFLVLLYVANDKRNINMQNLMKNIKGKGFAGVIDFVKEREKLVEIGIYCLMYNHFHMLVREKEEGGISAFMQKLLTAYSIYVNSKYDYSGSLFEGRFQSKHVDTDEYMKYLHSYIHLNPINYFEKNWKEKEGVDNVEGAKKFLKNYWYSSYIDFLGIDRPEKLILDTNNFPNYFGYGDMSFEDFIQGWLTQKNEFEI